MPKKEKEKSGVFFALKYKDEIVIWTIRETEAELVNNIMDTGEVFLNKSGTSMTLDELCRCMLEGVATIVKVRIDEV